MVLTSSFGLLHRIPPPPEGREPGTIPSELYEVAEDFEEQQLFVPAEVPQPIPVLDYDDYQEQDQPFHSVRSGYSLHGDHNDPPKPPVFGNGHTVHIHDYDQNGRDHHDNGYEHEEYDYGSSESSSPQVITIPFRPSLNAPTSHPNPDTHLGFGISRNMTPTQARPLSGLRNNSGSYTNGDSRP